ncbi:SWIM zinc finger family protein [Micromonospora sediminicola]|uniref:SWIM zinc finger family protein n=1 Tax=Micromonospora sediminicola TaxID=946078 RepID=UPI0033B0FCBF
MRTIESTSGLPDPSLPKARSLARNHAATLTIAAGHVSAEVVEADVVHRVRIDVPAWREPTRTNALRLITAATPRELAAGDLPDALEADFRRHGVDIAVRPEGRTSTCDCRARRRPCVHVLATVYSLAQLVDERPALAVDLRSPGATVTLPSADWIRVTDLDAADFYGD